MANIKYAGEEAVGRIADYVNKKLTFASSMPESPETNTIVLYVGSTSASYVQGGIYKFDGTNWILINSVQTIELTQAEYDALPSATKLNGTIYFITDAGGGSSSTDIVQGYLNPADGKFYEESTYETEITPNVDILYIDLIGNQIYRYDSTITSYIAISGSGSGIQTVTMAYYLAHKAVLDASDDIIVISDSGIANSADNVSYDHITSGLSAVNVKGAIDEINARISKHNIGTHVDVSSYTTWASPYVCPSDGYIYITANTSNSIAYGYIFTDGVGNFGISAHYLNGVGMNAIYVRKNMNVVFAFVGDGSAYFNPVT